MKIKLIKGINLVKGLEAQKDGLADRVQWWIKALLAIIGKQV